jgi:ankyrin repeat protein
MQCNACLSVTHDAANNDIDSVHPLLRAIVSYDAAAAQELLSKEPDSVNLRFEDSLTPLMHAVVAGDEAIVDLLLQ